MKQLYVHKNFSPGTVAIIDQANAIIIEYADQGYLLTLRQLYYQFVARDIIPNTTQSYKRLGSIVNDARLAGMIDWSAIEDRTRAVSRPPAWESPADILHQCAKQYRENLWEQQPCYVEVWVEKEALAGVIAQACEEWRVPYLSCRGYTSQSEMYESAMRFLRAGEVGQDCILLHLGDHDPSGIDMTRDIVDRLAMFGARVDVRRLALNMPQIDELGPPPNPAKVTDSRFEAYEQEYGDESWELDALEPSYIDHLVASEIESFVEGDLWRASQRKESAAIDRLEEIAAEQQ